MSHPEIDATVTSEDITRLLQEGRQAALEGRPVPRDERRRDSFLLSVHPAAIGPDDFQAAVLAGLIEVRGGLRKKYEDDFRAFLDEAAKAFGQGQGEDLPFLRSVASAWARWNSGRAPGEVTRRMARACGESYAALWRMAAGARLAESALRVVLHRADVRSQIRAMGWLEGEILRLHALRAPNVVTAVGGAEPDTVHFLEKNRYTILVKALKDCDPDYPRRVSATLPRIIEALRALVTNMRTSSDASVLEAADHLAGTPGSRRRGNVGSLVNYAICSGRLLDYVRDVENRFAGGDIVREIESALGKLGGNKATIISRSIHHGTLAYREKDAVKRAGVKPNKVENLESENRRLRNLVAELMLSRKELT